MPHIHCDFTFFHGKGLNDLNKLLKSNSRFVFEIHKRHKGKKKNWVVWRHKQKRTHGGDVKLIEEGGIFWGEITDNSNGMLTGAFLGWIIRNARDLVYGINFRQAD
jgi:hypothetical protein